MFTLVQPTGKFRQYQTHAEKVNAELILAVQDSRTVVRAPMKKSGSPLTFSPLRFEEGFHYLSALEYDLAPDLQPFQC